jgi:CDP-paratose 2-epimerase
MSVAVVTGSSGLIGSEAVRFLCKQGMEVIGIDNNLRQYFFGPEGSTEWNTQKLQRELTSYTHFSIDIRDTAGVNRIFRKIGADISLVVHAAAQPSHDWAAKEPFTDFSVNAGGTLVLLEATRQFCKEATFIFTSTNKVYGDASNELPIVEAETRWELDPSHPYAEHGIDESLRIDQSKHSIFGASKAAADLMTQEYGRYFGMKTGVFRGGCLTGPAHSAAELHGFLGYLVKCTVRGQPYTIYGYGGKQVRDNIHSHDLVSAFWQFHQAPRPGEVYNIGGSRFSHCSMLEAIRMVEELSGRELKYQLSPQARSGDHIWWVSDVGKFRRHYPAWSFRYDLKAILTEMVEVMGKRGTLDEHRSIGIDSSP